MARGASQRLGHTRKRGASRASGAGGAEIDRRGGGLRRNPSMQVLESCLRAVKVDGRLGAVARDNRALNRRRSSVDPSANVPDQFRAVRELNDGEEPGYGGADGADDGAMRYLSRISMSNPLSQLDVDRTELLGQPTTFRLHSERRRENATGDADRVLSDAQFVAQSSLDLKHPFGRRGRRDRVDGDGVVSRAKPQRAPNALIESSRIPRQVEMNDDRRLLKIEAFAEEIGGDQQVDTLRRTNGSTASRRYELRDDFVARRSAAGDPRALRREGGDAWCAREQRS
jgi:hypothetical protein